MLALQRTDRSRPLTPRNGTTEWELLQNGRRVAVISPVRAGGSILRRILIIVFMGRTMWEAKTQDGELICKDRSWTIASNAAKARFAQDDHKAKAQRPETQRPEAQRPEALSNADDNTTAAPPEPRNILSDKHDTNEGHGENPGERQKLQSRAAGAAKEQPSPAAKGDERPTRPAPERAVKFPPAPEPPSEPAAPPEPEPEPEPEPAETETGPKKRRRQRKNKNQRRR